MSRRVAAIVCGVLLLAAGAASAMSGEEVLQKVDDNQTYDNQVARMSMTLIDSRGIRQSREMDLYQKGDRRLVKFLKPADVRGVGFLSLPGDEMWLYMPALGKVRRISGQVKSQSFMGSDFSYDDMGGEKLGANRTVQQFREEGETYSLELVSNSREDSYSRLVLQVRKESFVPARVEFYDKRGKLLKVMTNDAVERVEGRWVAKKIEMHNVQDGHATLMEMLQISLDQRLGDEVFTQRNLMK